MPDEALLRVSLHHAGHDLVGGLVLLVAADDLDAPVLLVGGKDGEVDCRMSSITAGRRLRPKGMIFSPRSQAINFR